jgi:hypothetical protein
LSGFSPNTTLSTSTKNPSEGDFLLAGFEGYVDVLERFNSIAGSNVVLVIVHIGAVAGCPEWQFVILRCLGY